MTIRASILLIFAFFFLLFSVFLRSAWGGEEVSACESIAKAHKYIALARDRGTSPSELTERFRSMVEERGIPADHHVLMLEWVIYIYSTESTPEEIYTESRSACMKSAGQTEA